MRRQLVKVVLISFVVGWAFVGLHRLFVTIRSAECCNLLPYVLDFVLGGGITFLLLWLFHRQRQKANDEVAVRESKLEEAQAEIERQIEERKSAEQELVQAQKLEALGRLAGGIAHDVNNVLASIMTIASSMKLDVEADEKTNYDDIRDVLEACHRGRDLTLSLLGFSRKGDFFKRPLSLVNEIKDVKKLLERVSPRTLSINFEYEEPVPQIAGDPSEMKNVLMNLCINSIDAMNGKGVLTVSLDALNVEQSGHDGLSPGRYVLLRVNDTGEGMTEETKKRAFEPFYTTKPEGKGTGLGLPRVWGIVKEHSGTVRVDSVKGKGSTFKLMFPALDEAQEDPGIRGSLPPVYAGPYTVLLIDDEPLIRKSAKRILEKIGYQVIVAENGREGIARFTENITDIDLVLLDMIMPVLDGPGAFAAIRDIRPEIPVILCSGYSKDNAATELLKQAKVGFVQKPFSVGEISARMAQILKEK